MSNPQPPPDEVLLARAARCYATAGWSEEALRLFAQLGDDRHAGPLYEQQGLHAEAARCYARTGDWRRAAAASFRGGDPAAAAHYYERAGELLEAAWVLADAAGQPHSALALLERADPGQRRPGDAALTELVRARCETALGERAGAGRRLRALLAEQEAGSRWYRPELRERLVGITVRLGRPDLGALAHVQWYRAGLPGAREAWERWAEAVLEDTSGLPQPEAENEGPQPARRLSVLVVAHDHDAADTLVDLLEMWGFQARPAYNDVDAFQLAEDLRPNVILLQESVSGPDINELADRFRRDGLGDEAWLVALLRVSPREGETRLQAAGFHRHFVLPVNPEELRALLDQFESGHP